MINEKDEARLLDEASVKSEEIFNGIMLHVLRDSVTLPNGKPAVRELIRHVGAVAVLPVTDDGRVVLERQFRYPVNRVITEVPAGKLNSKAEDRLEAAKRELLEETGITAGKWTELGELLPAAAYCDEKLTLYLAQDLHFGKQKLDDDEFLNVYTVPFGEILDDVLEGRVPDAKTQVLVLKAAAKLGILRK